MQSAHCLATLSLDATCDGDDDYSLESPAMPAAPEGSETRSPSGAPAPYADNDTGDYGFLLPSVVFADSGKAVTSPLPHWPLTELYGYAVQTQCPYVVPGLPPLAWASQLSGWLLLATPHTSDSHEILRCDGWQVDHTSGPARLRTRGPPFLTGRCRARWRCP